MKVKLIFEQDYGWMDVLLLLFDPISKHAYYTRIFGISLYLI